MATVVTILSSDEEDNDDIQFVCEKPAGLRADIFPKKEVEDESPPKNEENKVKKIVPTLISTSVTITRVTRPDARSTAKEDDIFKSESPASPDDSANCRPSQTVAGDSDDDIICLDEEVTAKESKDASKPNCDNNQVSTNADVILLDSDNEDAESTKISNDICDESTNDAPSAPGSSEAKCDEKSDEEADNSSSVQEDLKSDDEISILEITSDDEKDEEDNGVDGDDKEKPNKTDDGVGGSELDDSSTDIDKTVANEAANQPSCSKASEDVDEIALNGPGNVTEKLLNHLLTKITQVGYDEGNVNTVKRKIMKYYDSSPGEFTQSQEFIDRIKLVITDITRMMERPDGKDLTTLSEISDKIKEFLTVFQRNSPHVTSKLNRLYKTYDKLDKRIKKLELQEVESDDEYEDAYVMMGRYKQKITDVYNKICELENKGNHADRNYKQEFVYSGVNGVPVPIQRALEKYYNKTKLFPDFQDVWKLVKKVNDSQKLDMNKTQAYNVASTLFTDFGTKLKRRRQYDDFLIMKSWVKEDAQTVTDPAQFDTNLQKNLELNRLKRRTEEEVLNDFVLKEAQNPAPANPGNDADEEEKSSELDKEDENDVAPGKTFVDSDEEMAALESVEERRRRTESDEVQTPAKKSKMDDSEVSIAQQNLENESTEKHETDPAAKTSFLDTCGLQPS